MKEWIYQIKLAPPGYDSFSRPTLACGIIEAEDKQSVCKHVSEQYPEYFDGLKVTQKLTKNTEQIVYLTIFELNDYWRKYWTSSVECCVCGKHVPLMEVRNNLGEIYLPHFTCCPECELQKNDALATKREEGSEEYWSNRCDYYYIYKITNKLEPEKCYIGYTEREPIFRWWEHYKHSDLPIGKALQGIGIKNFTFEILEMVPKDTTTVEAMHEIETSYIMKYDSINCGYNCVVSKTPVVGQKKLFNLSDE